MEVNLIIQTLQEDVIELKAKIAYLLKLVNSTVASKTLSNFAAVVNSDIETMTTTLEDFDTRVETLEQRVTVLENAES